MQSSFWRPFSLGLAVAAAGLLGYQTVGKTWAESRKKLPHLSDAESARKTTKESVAQVGTLPDASERAGADAHFGTAGLAKPLSPADQSLELPASVPAPPESELESDWEAPRYERRKEDPQSCLAMEGVPTSADVWSPAGRGVQLVIRARNTCARPFDLSRAHFRAYALSANGFELASARGRFYGPISSMGNAETFIALHIDPGLVGRYRVEIDAREKSSIRKRITRGEVARE